ncbi:chloride channel protein [Roseateles aquatilis]|uniref:Chloride channel protein n=1 Tax=Roseateles aquatilis TaxID=431061 RepID=A0A246JCK1_9BURK|nr:chloride channel protein [Roseateles aquatilis]
MADDQPPRPSIPPAAASEGAAVTPEAHRPADEHREPDFISAVREDLTDWRQWLSRAVVLAFAVAAGLAVVLFTWVSDQAIAAFAAMRAWSPWAPLVWTPCCTAALVWITRRYAPGAGGSGIPQVMAALSSRVPADKQGLFVSLRLSVSKLLLVSGGLLGGLAIGREGPSVQIAAGVMQHAQRWLPRRSPLNHDGLLVAGGAAGIAAAFNAPLAGVMFAIEELTRKIEQRSSGLIIASIVLSGLMAVSVFGNASYFGRLRVDHLTWAHLLPGLLTAIGCGLAGGVFSRLLQRSLLGGNDRFSRWRARFPVRFAFACGVAIAVLGLVSHGATDGSGYDYTRGLVEGHLDLPVLYVTLRIVATWLAVWSGVPGGIFAPSLAIGAGIGSDIAQLTSTTEGAAALIAIGMTAFLAAVTQAPVTAFIIVMEMVDGHSMVLSLMAAALLASLVSRWISVPIYHRLALAQLARLPSTEAARSDLKRSP